MTNKYDPKYLASLIYDRKNNDRSIIIKDYTTNEQVEHKINDGLRVYHQDKFYITDKNNKNIKVPLDEVLKEKNYKSISRSHENNGSISFALDRTETAFLEKHNFIEQSNEMRLANAVWEYEMDNLEWNIDKPDMDIDGTKKVFMERYNSILNKEKVHEIAHTSVGSYSVKINLDFESLAYKEEVINFQTHEKLEEITLYNSVDKMIKDIKELDFDEISQERIHDFDKQLQEQYKLKEEAMKLLNEHGFDSTTSELSPSYTIDNPKPYEKMVDFNDQKAQEFILKYSLNQTNSNAISLQEKWTDLENKYHELGTTVSPDKLNQVTAKLIENKLDFKKCLTDDMMNNRIVTMFKSDKELLKHSVDHLKRAKMYALLSSAKKALADVRIKSDSLDSERETILVDKITDLESRVAPPLKATLEKVNTKVNTTSNVRATANALQNVQIKTKVQENTVAKEPVHNSIKKTRSAELSR